MPCDMHRKPSRSRALPRTLAWPARALLACLALIAPLAQASPICPVNVVSGDNQLALPGSMLPAPIVVKQHLTDTVTPIPATFIWTITSGNARFPSGGTTFTATSVPYTGLPGAYEAMSSQNIVITGTSGTVSITVQSNVCSTAGPPATLTATIARRNLIPLEGNGVSAAVGETVRLRGQLGGAVPTTTGILGMSSVTLTVTAGQAAFASGAQTITMPLDMRSEFAADLTLLAPGPITVQATSSLSTVAPIDFNLLAFVPATLTIISGDNQRGVPNQRGEPLVVEVRLHNAPASGIAVQWTVVSGSRVTLDGNTSTSNSQGRAQMGLAFGPAPGTTSIAASLPSGEVARFTVTNGTTGGQAERRLSIVSGDAQSGAIGALADEPIVVRLAQADGQPASGEQVRFSVLEGSASLSVASATTGADGKAQVRTRYGASAGALRIKVEADNAAAVFATATVYSPQFSILSGNGQTGAPGTALAEPLTVKIERPASALDLAKSNSGVTVNWRMLSGNGNLTSTQSMTDEHGLARNRLILGNMAGIHQVEASIDGAPPLIFVATAVGGTTVRQFEIASGNNQSLPPQAPSAPLVVRLKAADGTPIQGTTVHWRAVPADGATLSAPTSVTDSHGEASVSATLLHPGQAQVVASVSPSDLPELTFTLNGGIANIGGLNERQRNLGTAIDRLCPRLAARTAPLTEGQRDLLDQCSELVRNAGPNPNRVAPALDELIAQPSHAQRTAALTSNMAQLDNLRNRLNALRHGARGVNLQGLTFAAPTGSLPMSLLASNVMSENDGGERAAATEFDRWGFFATGTISQGSQDPTEAGGGFDFDTWGLTAGVDYRFSDRLVAGVALGYAQNDTDAAGERDTLSTEGQNLSGYFTFEPFDGFYADGSYTYGKSRYDLARHIDYRIEGAVTTLIIDQIASASPDGSQRTLAFTLGKDFSKNGWTMGPYWRAVSSKIQLDGYQERMSAPRAPGAGLAMAVAERELKSLESTLGARASYAFSTDWGVLLPGVQLEWLREFEDDPQLLVTRFLYDPEATPIVIREEEIDPSYFNLGLSLTSVFSNGRSAYLYFDHRAGQRGFSQNNLALGFRMEF